jgi:formate hydrogenlyase subunit 3/multisubunit Na+/H+ antiporter MnhD subunit
VELILPLAVALPLALALLSVLPALRPSVAVVAPWAAVPALAAALVLPTDTVVELPWLLLGTRVVLDRVGQVFLLFTAALWVICGVYARGYLPPGPGSERFFLWSLVTMTGSLGVVMAGDVVAFYTCFAMLSFASYPLIVHAGDEAALRAGRVYIAFVVGGEAMLFVGIAGLAGLTGTLAFPGEAATAAGSGGGRLMLWLLLAGFGVKVGMVPLHLWLPLAHPAAPVPASAVLSGLIIKAGLLGWLRFLPLGVVPLPEMGAVCLVLGLVAAFGGVLVGLAQREAKAALAYSSISQMGLMTVAVGAGLGAPAAWPLLGPAVLLYALHHAFAKAALFLGVGVAAHARAGAGARTLVVACLAVPAIALTGMPWTSGAAAKVALKQGLAGVVLPVPFIDLLLSLAAMGTTLLMARVLVLVWHARASTAHGAGGGGLAVPWGVTLAAVLGLVWVLPWPELSGAAQASLGAAYRWPTFWPPAVAALAAWLVWRRTAAAQVLGTPSIPPGDLIVPAGVVLGWLAAAVRWVCEGADRVDIDLRRAVGLPASGDVARVLHAVEAGLGEWLVAGVVLLALLLLGSGL